MLQVSRIDVKTGLLLQEMIEGKQQPKTEQTDHSYLEHWLDTHGLEAQFYKGKFYDGVNAADRLRLEAEGKVLAFTNGKSGYFTDATTAQLMTGGDAARGIAPIYANNQNSPHNFVAYGSLVTSDGIASTSIPSARILVVDDERRTHGEKTVLDITGQPVSRQQWASIYDKMGDGTMLVTPAVMQDLITTEERDQIAAKAFEKLGVGTDITAITQGIAQVEAATALGERQIEALASRTVTQFRAATPDLPGVMKGTMASSEWCKRLGVDAIVSSNDIKGDDGRLSEPGIKEVDFWINRKSDGRYGEQVVGPQVKGCIPKATLHEFNPQMKRQAEELAEVAADPVRLSQHYVQKKEQQRARTANSFDNEGEAGESQPERPDWLYEVLKADTYQQLSQFGKVNKALSRDLKDKWLDNALSGICIPSAMAQHHGQLKPWEVCNKDLPHGAIIACYRSPFPNAGAAEIAINNTDIIKEKDREAFSKQGVAYLSPWTAKSIAITDFDGDTNGFFVGYEAAVPDLPKQIRQQLASVENLLPAQQYEAARALFGEMIEQQEGQETRISPADYPLTVKEFIDLNAPGLKPPEITKQKKEKHSWHENESHASATWRAWEITADNPTGKVANLGMALRSLASEITCTPPEQRERLLRQISVHCYKQFVAESQAGGKQQPIPTDERLQDQGLPAYGFEERIRTIAKAGVEISRSRSAKTRAQFVEKSLQSAAHLLTDIVNGPLAVNLQTAVDTAKSCRGIDESLHTFARTLQYKPDLIREHQKDPDNYVGKKTLPTNTQEPIAWGVEAVNALYEDVQLPELKHEAFKDLFPKSCTPPQETRALAIARTYNDLIAVRRMAKDRLRERRPEDQQPTLLITTPGGRELILQNISDTAGTLPIWRADGKTDWTLTVENADRDKLGVIHFPAKLTFTDAKGETCTQSVGEVSPESVEQHDLERRLPLTISNPHAQIRVPFAQENDAKELIARAMDYAKTAVENIPIEEHPTYLSALWRQHDGMGFALKQFTKPICDRLQTIPEITLTGLQQSINEVGQISPGEYTARFSEYSYEKAGAIKTSPSIALIAADGSEQQFGALSNRSAHLPRGTTVTAHIAVDESGKTARMQVLDLAASPELSPTVEAPLALSASNDTVHYLAVEAPPNLLEFPSQTELPMVAETSAIYNISPSTDATIAGKPVQMVFPLKLHREPNPLPVDSCIEAMRGYGRCQTTRTFEPYAAYGFKAGDLAIAQCGEKEVAFRVGEQYRITPALVTSADFPKQWAAMEKHSARELEQLWQHSQSQGKPLWSLRMEPLGDFVDGQIVPFPDRSSEIYSPSRQELRQWCAVAMASKDEPLKAQIIAKGQQLKALHELESGSPSAEPPLEYRHPLIVLSNSDRQLMQQSIERAQAMLHALSETVQPPSQFSQFTQLEAG